MVFLVLQKFALALSSVIFSYWQPSDKVCF